MDHNWALRNYFLLCEPVALLGSLTTFTKSGAVPPDVLLGGLARTVALLEAPFAYLDDWAQAGFKDRDENHRIVYQESKKAGEDKRFGLFRGLSGIAWRTILGPDLVRFFGEKKLSSLPPHFAHRLGDKVWLLTPCEAAHEWSPDALCKGEAEIINTLGQANFFDPVAKELPTKIPDIRMMPTLPVKFLSPDARNIFGPFEHHNGYVES